MAQIVLGTDGLHVAGRKQPMTPPVRREGGFQRLVIEPLDGDLLPTLRAHAHLDVDLDVFAAHGEGLALRHNDRFALAQALGAQTGVHQSTPSFSAPLSG